MGLFSSMSRRERGPMLRAEDLRKGMGTLSGKNHAPQPLSSPLNRRTLQLQSLDAVKKKS